MVLHMFQTFSENLIGRHFQCVQLGHRRLPQSVNDLSCTSSSVVNDLPCCWTSIRQQSLRQSIDDLLFNCHSFPMSSDVSSSYKYSLVQKALAAEYHCFCMVFIAFRITYLKNCCRAPNGHCCRPQGNFPWCPHKSRF